ncbi:MAG: helix-turn-helix domain-containing protein [Eubacteriales bacterium]
MSESIYNDIINYIELLRTEFGLSLTLHPTDTILSSGFGTLYRYNFHTSPLCLLCKLQDKSHARCVMTQKLIQRKCAADGGKPFFGLCHAGIGGYIFPIYNKSSFIGYICANGYVCDEKTSRTRLRRLAALTGEDIGTLLQMYENSICTNGCADAGRLEALIMPLVHMLRFVYLETERSIRENQYEPRRSLNLKIVSYLYQNSASDISVDTVAQRFHFSRSYISHMFKNCNGVSFSEFLCRVRLENAAGLLVSSSLPVSSVASEVGFDDANYFSKIFRRHFGISPREYRNSNR